MSNVKVYFREREDLTVYKKVEYPVIPKRYSWNVFGGPEELSCEVILGGQSEPVIWSLTNLLRCGVEVWDWRGVPVWWGYVHEMKINNGSRIYGVSMDTCFNRVRTTYELLLAGSATGIRADTTWQTDTRSQAIFGTREKNYSMTSVSAAVADADVLTRLEKSRVPTSVADLQYLTEANKGIEIVCKGWWYTLDDLYYQNLGTNYTAVDVQLVDIIEEGEFIEGTTLNCSAATLNPEYRLGDELLRDEAEKLMNIGTDNSRRILTKVDKDRYVEIFEEPAKNVSNYYLDKFNNLYDNLANYVSPTECRVGHWAVLKDFEGISYVVDSLVGPSPVFIERASYDCQTMQYQPEQRGYRSPYEEIQVIQR